jgi:hypothetical protein
MHPIGRLIMAIVTEPYHKTEPIRFISQSTTEYVMPFKPTPRATDKAI